MQYDYTQSNRQYEFQQQPMMYNNQFPQYQMTETMAHNMYNNQPMYPHLKQETLQATSPFAKYGLTEAKATSYQHAFLEVAAMAYLLGKGLDPQTAYYTVESWEVNEKF